MISTVEGLILEEIIKLKNINKSLGQKIKHYSEMLLLKDDLVVKQQKCLSSFGDVVDKDLFAIRSKELLDHLEYLRDYESRSDVLNIPKVIEVNNKRIMVLRNAIGVIKCSQH